MTSILVRLDLSDVTSGLAASSSMQCPNCDDPLVMHQPDEQSPDRLLGTCEECGAWFLLDLAGEVMVRLPDVESLRETQSSSQRPLLYRSPRPVSSQPGAAPVTSIKRRITLAGITTPDS